MEALSFEEELKKNGVSLLFTMESYDNTPIGKFMKLVSYANNQLYSDIYSVKISDGLSNNAKESLTTGNNVPLGFKTNKETKEFEIDEVNAPIVKEIFERYAKGDTVADIINGLNERGYNAVHQIAGYLISNDPAYISSHKNARNIIQQIERDEIIEELVKSYLGKNK